MNLTSFAIANDRLTAIILLVTLLGGVLAIRTMEQTMDPGFTIRTCQIVTGFPGANPERVEALVTDQIEKAVQEVPEIDFVSSTSKTGISIVSVNIRNEFNDMRPIWDDVRRKVEAVARNLPEGSSQPEVNDDFGAVYGTIVAVTGDGFDYRELKDVAQQLRDALLRLANVGRVDIVGTQDERIFVAYNDARLAELELSVSQISQILESRNILISGGSIVEGRERLELEPSGSFESVEQLKRTVISVPDQPVFLHLEDIAEVTRGYVDPPKSRVRANGRPALVLAVSVREGGNVVALGKEVQEVLDRLRGRYPLGIDLDIVAFEPVRVENKVNDFAVSVLQAVVIVLGCMLLMLGLRTGLVVAALVPCALLTSLLVMRWLDLGLNQMTLASLIIALGMLVDNAIVMSESIMVAMSHGTPRVQAAVQSANELRVPLLTSSLTTSAAFLPIYVAEGSMGEYTGVLFVVVTIALLSSWLLSLTVVPLLCARFLRVPAAEPGHDYSSLFFRAYRGLLLAMVRIPLLSAAVTVVVFLVSLWGFSRVPKVFFPPRRHADDDGRVQGAHRHFDRGDPAVRRGIRRLCPGRTCRQPGTSRRSGQLVHLRRPGSAPLHPHLRTSTAEPGVCLRALQSHHGRHPARSGAEDRAILRRAAPFGHSVSHPAFAGIRDPETGGDSGLRQRPEPGVRDCGRRQEPTSLHRRLRNVDDDWGEMTKKLTVGVDAVRAKRNGVTHRDIAVSLRSILSGYKATEYREGSEIIPVTIRSVDAGRQDISKLESLNVFSQSRGTSVPLMQVADLALGWQPAKLLRRNRLTTVTVSSELADGATAAEVTGQVAEWLQETSPSWPAGIFYEIGGEAEESARSEGAIMGQAPLFGIADHHSAGGAVQFDSPVSDRPADHSPGAGGHRDRPAGDGRRFRIHDLARSHLPGRHRDQQCHRPARPDPDRNSGEGPHPASCRDRGVPAPAASHPADHGHHHRWTPAPLVRRRPHVGVHGDRGDLRPVVRNDPHPGRGAGALHAPVSGEVQGFPLRIGGGAHGVPQGLKTPESRPARPLLRYRGERLSPVAGITRRDPLSTGISGRVRHRTIRPGELAGGQGFEPR